MSCKGTPGPPGPPGPVVINPTDLFIPYRVNATTFGDSPWFFSGGEVLGNFPPDTTFVFGDGVLLFRENGVLPQDFTKGSLWQNNNAATALSPAHWSPSFNFEAKAWTTTDHLSTGVFFFAQLEPIPAATQLAVSSKLHLYSMLNLTGQTPAEQFSIASDSGYTGTGTLFLSDDGTYKPAGGGGGGLTVLDNGAFGPSGPGSYSIDIPANSTSVDDSWHLDMMGVINSSGFTSLEVQVAGGTVYASAFGVNTFNLRMDIYRMAGSTNNLWVSAVLITEAGLTITNSQLITTADWTLPVNIDVFSGTAITIYSRTIYKVPHA